MIKILIADDHPLARRGLKDILQDEPDITVAGEAENGREVLQKVRTEACDVLIMDLSMPGLSGLDLLKQLKTMKPKLPVLVVTMHPEKRYAIRTLKAGAAGYLSKGCPPADLIAAVKKVASGGKYTSFTLAESLVQTLSDGGRALHETLSDREFQILCMIASGMTVSEIAHKLSLSVSTVSTHRTRILEKMHMENNAQLTHYALANGLTDD